MQNADCVLNVTVQCCVPIKEFYTHCVFFRRMGVSTRKELASIYRKVESEALHMYTVAYAHNQYCNYIHKCN